MKPAYFFFFLTLLATGCATTDQHGIDESQKTRLAEQVSHWAGKFNARDWQGLTELYAPQVDFNSRPLSNGGVVATIGAFMEADKRFQLTFDPETWALDSMRGVIFSGHLNGTAEYGFSDESKVETRIGFWLRMEGEGAPLIAAQFDEIGSAYKVSKQRHNDFAMQGQDFDSTGMPNYTFWDEITHTVQPLVGKLHYFGKHLGDRLFYAEDKNAPGKMGIVNEKGIPLIPYSYDDIGSIGVMLEDAVEVKLGTKKGMMRMDGTVIMPLEFDAILPIFNDPQRKLWAYRDGAWACYDAAGKAVIPEGGSGDGIGPDWVAYLAELPLEDLWKPCHKQGIASPLGSYYVDSENAYLQDYGVVRMPFTLVERHVLEDMTGGSMEMGGSISMHIDSVFVSESGQVQMLSTVETWGIGGRESYHDLDTRWVVFEPELRDTASSIHLYTQNLEGVCDVAGMRVIGDTLVEAMEMGSMIEYWRMPKFSYFKPLQNGGIQPLLAEREFPFMSLIPIDKEFLKGCFHGSANDQEMEAYKQKSNENLDDEYASLLRTAKFYRASDLDYLVNEVYAAHGMEFNNAKWKEYFGEKPWYKPSSQNVEKELSALEQKNIAFVRELQAQVRRKESAYTEESFTWQESF
jgi:hypothetical protein